MQVELQDIKKYFGPVKANDGISLIFESGCIYGLLGENGAGKSTLMKILSGYQPPDSGDVLLDNQDLSASSPADALGAGVGMLYQEPLDFPPFRIIDNYLLGREKNVVLDFKTASKELRDLISQYNFDLDIHAYVDTLSLGERQQLELIRLLAGGAQVLILDEPTTGISAEQKDILFSTMRRLAHEEGKTLILVSHKLDEVQELCDYAFVLRKGKLIGGTGIPCRNEVLVEMMFGQLPPRSERSVFQLGEPLLELHQVSLSSYRLIVKDINLQVYSGEVFGLAGLEGSGQRLLMQACAGLIHPDTGNIYLQGQAVSTWSYHRMMETGVAYVTAGRLEEGLVAGLSLTEHVVLTQPSHNFLVDWSEARKKTARRIERYQIVGHPDNLAAELSGGNQQRLLFALLGTPLRLILLEHPTRGLDVRSTNYIWELLYNRREDGTAILFISDDLEEIIERSDRIAVFYSGRMSRVVKAKDTSVDELGHLIGGQL